MVVATRVGNACWRLAVEARCSGCPPARRTARGEGTSQASKTLPAREEVAGGPGQPKGRCLFRGGGRPDSWSPVLGFSSAGDRGLPPTQRGFSLWTQEAKAGGHS